MAGFTFAAMRSGQQEALKKLLAVRKFTNRGGTLASPPEPRGQLCSAARSSWRLANSIFFSMLRLSVMS